MIELGAGTLTCEQIYAIAVDREPVALAPRVAARLAEGHRAVLLLAEQGPVYGRSTGVGALLTARLRSGPTGPDRPAPPPAGAGVAGRAITPHSDRPRTACCAATPPPPARRYPSSRSGP